MVDHKSDRPLYRQVADKLRARIASGDLAPGASVGTADHLARTYGVGVDAVRDAITELRGAGLVETRRGHPARVRAVGERTAVSAGRGSTVSSEMPTPEERAAHGMPPGVPMLVVHDAGGRLRGRWPAHLYVVRCS